MWSRVVEVTLGCWLLMSPFIFRYAPHETALWINDFACAAAVIVFGLMSYWSPARHTHALSLVVGGWLIAFAYWRGFGNASPASQNHLLVGWLMMMFAVIPNRASRPPAGWEDHAVRQADQ
jgi:hypothetical protein